MPTRLLLVEPDAEFRTRLLLGTDMLADVSAVADFHSARQHLLTEPCDWVITNIRLNAYNGLHLLHLSASADIPTRVLVYADRRDAALAREAQLAGAFYEVRRTVHRVLGSYINKQVPPFDRRNAEVSDRRRISRGGRRCSDAMPARVVPAEVPLSVWPH
ncbi:MAG TPA: hypothetical protein VJP86_02555 [Vicinamibacterales bacterium]|jgi:DNA-binding NtrC family response regulator|nr:hypothetical protein [Vicinamibacterales bacterium]